MCSDTLRTVMEDQIAYYMVLPNKIPIQLVEGIDMSKLKFPHPQVSHKAFLMFLCFNNKMVLVIAVDLTSNKYSHIAGVRVQLWYIQAINLSCFVF